MHYRNSFKYLTTRIDKAIQVMNIMTNEQ